MQSIDLRCFEGRYEVFVEQHSGDFSVTTFAIKNDAVQFIEKLLSIDCRDKMDVASVNIDVSSSHA